MGQHGEITPSEEDQPDEVPLTDSLSQGESGDRRRIILGSHLGAGMPVRESI